MTKSRGQRRPLFLLPSRLQVVHQVVHHLPGVGTVPHHAEHPDGRHSGVHGVEGVLVCDGDQGPGAAEDETLGLVVGPALAPRPAQGEVTQAALE